jgi:chemotaxis protein CheD
VAETAQSEVARRTRVVVDIAELVVSKDPADVLITYSLGSCIGVALWDPRAGVAGLLHYMLPESKVMPKQASDHPAMFCDTGVPKLFQAAYELGATKRRLVVKLAGGSQLLDDDGTFDIGRRNYLALRKIFWKNGVPIERESVGGPVSRSMRIDVATGTVTVKTRGEEVSL